MLRAVKTEARITINGIKYDIGALTKPCSPGCPQKGIQDFYRNRFQKQEAENPVILLPVAADHIWRAFVSILPDKRDSVPGLLFQMRLLSYGKVLRNDAQCISCT